MSQPGAHDPTCVVAAVVAAAGVAARISEAFPPVEGGHASGTTDAGGDNRGTGPRESGRRLDGPGRPDDW
jgi:hypothetical protein